MRKIYATPQYVIYPYQRKDVLTSSNPLDPTVADADWEETNKFTN